MSTLTALTQKSESSSKIISDTTTLSSQLQISSAKETSIEKEFGERRPSEIEGAERIQSDILKEQSQLSGHAAGDQKIESDIELLKLSGKKVGAELTEIIPNLQTSDIKLQEPGEESVHGFWRTTEVEGSSTQILETQQSEIGKEQMSLKASGEEQVGIDKSISQVSDESIGKTIGDKSKEFGEKSLSIEKSESQLDISKPSQDLSVNQKLKQEVRDASESQRIHEIGESNVQVEGVLSTLTSPPQSSEDASKVVREKRLVRQDTTIDASSEEVSQMSVENVKPDEFSGTSYEGKVSEIQKADLSGKASQQREISASVGFSDTQPHDLQADSLQKTPSSDKLSTRIKQPSEENVHGFWKTTDTEGTSTQILKSDQVETVRGQLSLKASQECLATLDQDVSKISDETCEKKIAEKSMELGQKSLSIEKSDSMHEIKQLRDESMDTSKSLKDTPTDSTISQKLHEVGDVSVQVGGVVSTLIPPSQSSEDVSKIVDQKQLIKQSASLDASKEESSSTFMGKIKPDEMSSTSFDGKVSEIQKVDLSSKASEQRETSQTIGFSSTIPNELQAESRMQSTSTDKLSAQMKEFGDENVHGFWKTSDSGESSMKILKSDQIETIKSQISLKASQENLTSLDQNISKVSEESTEKTISGRPKELGQKSLSIDQIESSQEIRQLREQSVGASTSLTDKIRHSASMSSIRQIADVTAQVGGVVSTLRPPRQSMEDVSKIIAEKRLLKRSLSLGASREVTAHTSMGKVRPDQMGSASYNRKVVQMQRAGLSSRASEQREISSNVGFSDSLPRDMRTDALQKSASTDRLSARFKESQEVNFHGFWKSHRAESTSALDFEIGEILTNQVKMSTKASQDNLTSLDKSVSKTNDELCEKTMKQKSKMMGQRSLSIERSSSMHNITQSQEDSVSISASMKESIRVRESSQPIRETVDVSAQVGGVVSTLIPPSQSMEDISKIVKDRPQLKTSASFDSSKEEFANTSMGKVKPEEISGASYEGKLAEKQEIDLTSRASEQREISASVGFSDTQPHDLQADSLQKTPSSDKLSTRIKQPSEENVHGFWKTVGDESTSAKIIGTGQGEVARDQLSLKASQENLTSLDQSISKISDESIEKSIGDKSKAVGEKSLSIEKSDSTHEIRQAQESQIETATSLRDVPRDSAISQFQEFGDVSAQMEGAVSTLMPPKQSSEDASKIVDEKQLIKQSASMDSSKEESASIFMGKIKPDQMDSAAIESKISEMQNANLKSQASKQREISSNIGFEDSLPHEMGTESLQKSSSIDKLSTTIKQPSEENVHGFWKTVDNESTSTKVLESGSSETVKDQVSLKASQENLTSLETSLDKTSDETCHKTFDEKSKELGQKSLSIEKVDSLHEITPQQDQAISTGADMRDTARESAMSQPIREFTDVSAQLEGIMSTLTALTQRSESSSQVIADKSIVSGQLSVSATEETSTEREFGEFKPTESETTSKVQSEILKEQSQLSGRAADDQRIDSIVELSKPKDVQSQIELTGIAQNLQSADAKLQQPGDESVHGFWKTVEVEGSSAKILEKSAIELSKDQLSLKASQEDQTRIDQTLCKVNDESIEKSIGDKSKAIGEKSLSIERSDSLHDIQKTSQELGVDEKLKIVAHDSVSQKLHELGDSQVQLEGLVSTLTPPSQSMEDASKVVTEKSTIAGQISVSATKETSIEKEFGEHRLSEIGETSKIQPELLREQSQLSGRAAGDQKIDTDSELLKVIDSKSQVELVGVDQHTQSAGIKLQESREEVQEGFWSTKPLEESAAQSLIEQKSIVSEQGVLTTKAPSDATSTSDQKLEKIVSDHIQQTLGVGEKEVGSGQFAIDSTSKELEIGKPPSDYQRGVTLTDKSQESNQLEGLREFGDARVEMQGLIQQSLTAPSEHSIESSATISESRKLQDQANLQSAKRIDTSVEVNPSRGHGQEEAQLISKMSNTSSTDLSTKGATLVESSIGKDFSQPESSSSAEKVQKSKSSDRLSQRMKETTDETSVGIYSAEGPSPSAEQQITCSDKIAIQEKLDTNASRETATSFDEQFSREVREGSQFEAPDKQKESTQRGFAVERIDTTSEKSKLDENKYEDALLTEKNRAALSADMQEYGEESINVQCGLHSLSRADQDSKIKSSTQQLFKSPSEVALQANLKASKESDTSLNVIQSRDENQGNAQLITKSKNQSSTDLSTKGTTFEESSIGKDLVLPESSSSTEKIEKSKRMEQLSQKMKESTDEATLGIWNLENEIQDADQEKVFADKFTIQNKLTTAASRESATALDKQFGREQHDSSQFNAPETIKEQTQRGFSAERVETTTEQTNLEKSLSKDILLSEKGKTSLSADMKEFGDESINVQCGLHSQAPTPGDRAITSARISEKPSEMQSSSMKSATLEEISQTFDNQKIGEQEQAKILSKDKPLETGSLQKSASQTVDTEIETQLQGSEMVGSSEQVQRVSSDAKIRIAVQESQDENTQQILRTVEGDMEAEGLFPLRLQRSESMLVNLRASVARDDEDIAEFEKPLEEDFDDSASTRAQVAPTQQVLYFEPDTTDKRQQIIIGKAEQERIEAVMKTDKEIEESQIEGLQHAEVNIISVLKRKSRSPDEIEYTVTKEDIDRSYGITSIQEISVEKQREVAEWVFSLPEKTKEEIVADALELGEDEETTALLASGTLPRPPEADQERIATLVESMKAIVASKLQATTESEVVKEQDLEREGEMDEVSTLTSQAILEKDKLQAKASESHSTQILYEVSQPKEQLTVEQTIEDKNREAMKLSGKEPVDQSAFGFWSTEQHDDSSQIILGSQQPPITDTARVQAPGLQETDKSINLEKIVETSTSGLMTVRPEERVDTTLGISESSAQVDIIRPSPTTSAEITQRDVLTSEQQIKLKEQGDESAGMLLSTGILQPPISESEASHVEVKSKIGAKLGLQTKTPSEEKLEKDTDIRKREDSSEADLRTAEKITDKDSLTTKASELHESKISIDKSKQPQDSSIEKTTSSSQMETAEFKGKEMEEAESFGFWRTQSQDDNAQITMRGQSPTISSTAQVSAPKTSDIEGPAVDLGRDENEVVIDTLGLRQIARLDGTFGISSTDITSEISQLPLSQDTQIVQKSSVQLPGEQVSLKEQGDFVAGTDIGAGILVPPQLQSEQSQTLVKDQSKELTSMKTKAAGDESLLKEASISKGDQTANIELQIQEQNRDQGILSTRSAELRDSSVDIDKSKIPRDESVESKRVGKNVVEAEFSGKESGDVESFGFWRTQSQEDASQFVLPSKDSVADKLSTKAPETREMSIDRNLQQEIRDEVSGEVKDRAQPDRVSGSFGIDQASTTSVLEQRIAGKGAEILSSLISKESEFASVHMQSDVSASTDVQTGQLQVTREADAEASTKLLVSGKMNVEKSMSATKISDTKLDTTYCEPESEESKSIVMKEGHHTRTDLRTRAPSEELTQLSTEIADKSKGPLESQTQNILPEKLKDSAKLRADEISHEEATTLVKAECISEDAQKTLKDRPREIESVQKSLAAFGDTQIDSSVEISRSLPQDTTTSVASMREQRDSAERTFKIQQTDIQTGIAREKRDVDDSAIAEGIQPCSEVVRCESRQREVGSAEAASGMNLGRIVAPPPQKEETEKTLRMTRNLSIERSTKAAGKEDLDQTVQLQGPPRSESTDRKFSIVQRSSSGSDLKAITKRETSIERTLAKSQSDAEVSERIIKDKRIESAASRMREAQEEVTTLSSVTVELEGDAEIKMRSQPTDILSLSTTAPQQEQIGTTLDLSVRKNLRSDDLILPLERTDSTERKMEIHEAQKEIDVRAEDLSEHTEYTADNTCTESVAGSMAEFGEDDVRFTSEFVKLHRRRSQSAEISQSISEARKLKEVIAMLATQDTGTELREILEKLPQAAALDVMRNETTGKLYEALKLAQTMQDVEIANKLGDTDQRTEFTGKDKNITKDEFRTLPAQEEGALSQYTTVETDLDEITVIGLKGQEKMVMNLIATQLREIQAQASLSNEPSEVQAQKNIPLQPRLSEERQFKIEQTSSDGRMLTRSDSAERIEKIQREQLKQSVEGKYIEQGDENVQVSSYFGKIVRKKFERKEAEKTLGAVRLWTETLSTKRAALLEKSQNYDFDRSEQPQITERVFKVDRRETENQLSAKAVSTQMCTVENIHMKTSQYEHTNIKLQASTRERIVKQLKEQEWNLQSADSMWDTILDDLETEVTQKMKIEEKMTLQTKSADQISASRTQETMQRDDRQVTQLTSTTEKVTESQQQRSEMTTKQQIQQRLAISGLHEEMLEVEEFVDELYEQQQARRVEEKEEEEVRGAVSLVRQSKPQVRSTLTHVITIDTSLKQSFTTAATADVYNEASVTLSLPALLETTERRISEKLTESGKLETKAVQETQIKTAASYSKEVETTAATMARRKLAERAVSKEKLKEIGSDEIEILSLYEGVERDLEAEALFPRHQKVASTLKTISTAEEVIVLAQEIKIPEQSMQISRMEKVQIKESQQRNFAISNVENLVSLQKAEPETQGSERTVPIANRATPPAPGVFREFGHEELKAVINLHKFDIQNPSRRNEFIVPEIVRFVLQPFYVASETPSDVVWIEQELQKALDQQETSRTVQAKNTERLKRRLVESEENEVKLAVEYMDRQPAEFAQPFTWREARDGGKAELTTEEFGHDETLVYAQLTSEHITFDEKEITKLIARRGEPLTLRTPASKEETHSTTYDWRKPEQSDATDKLFVICNRGEDLERRMRESEEHTVATGIRYDKPHDAMEVPSVRVTPRFGGKYDLRTKAAGDETKNLAVTLSQKVQFEKITQKWVEKLKQIMDKTVTETTTEVAHSAFVYEREQQHESHIIKKIAANQGTPVTGRFIETQEVFATVYYDMEERDKVETTSKLTWIPNTIDGLNLKCDAAEHIEATFTSDLKRIDEFERASIKRVDCNWGHPMSLRTFEPTIVAITFATMFSRDNEPARIDLVIKDKNRGQPMKLRTKESEEEKHSIFKKFEKDDEYESKYKKIFIPVDGGCVALKTDASQEHETRIERFIEKQKDLILHSHLLTHVPNSTTPISLHTKATTLVEYTIGKDMHKTQAESAIELKITDSNRAATEKRVIESTENNEYIHPIYKRPDDSVHLDETWFVPRQGGQFGLKAKSAGEENVERVLHLDKGDVKDLQTEWRKILSVQGEPLSFRSMASVETMRTINQTMSKLTPYETTKITVVDKHRGEPVKKKMRESEEHRETVVNTYRKEPEYSGIEKTMKEANFGGLQTLNTKAATTVSSTMSGTLLCPRPTNLEHSKTNIIPNTTGPVNLKTKASTLESHTVNEIWNKDESRLGSERTQQIARLDKAEFRVQEAGEEHETTNCAYSKDVDNQETQRVLHEKRHGGTISLSTKYAKDERTDRDIVLNKDLITFLEAPITFTVPNTTSPNSLSTKASTSETMGTSVDWRKPEPIEQTSVQKEAANRGEPAAFKCTESTEKKQNLSLQLERKAKKEELDFTKWIANTLEGELLRTKASRDVVITTDAAVQCSQPFELDAIIVIRAKRDTDKPILVTSCSKEASTSTAAALTKSAQAEACTRVTRDVNRAAPQAASVRETTAVNESASCVYEREPQKRNVSETRLIARDGGRVSWTTKASCEVQATINYVKQKDIGPRELDAERRTILTNKGEPAELFASASQDLTIGTTVQLNRAAPYEGTMITLVAPRKGDDAQSRVRETESCDETINVRLGKPEGKAEIELTVKIAAYGGGAQLRAGSAKENEISISPTIAVPTEDKQTESTRKMPRVETAGLRIGAATEESVSVSQEISSGRSSNEHVEFLNPLGLGVEFVYFRSTESCETASTVNYTLRRPERPQFEEIILKEPMYGGGTNISCRAAGEESPDGVHPHFTCPSPKDEASFSLFVPRLDQAEFRLHAAEETFGGTKDVEIRRTEQVESISLLRNAAQLGEGVRLYTKASAEENITLTADIVCGRLGTYGEAGLVQGETEEGDKTGLRTNRSEETEFNLFYDYTKQATEFGAVFITSDKDMIYGAFGMRAPGVEIINLEELNVQRRMVEVQVEGVIERAARECSPLTLTTESMAETVIRVDETLTKTGRDGQLGDEYNDVEVKMRDTVDEKSKEVKR